MKSSSKRMSSSYLVSANVQLMSLRRPRLRLMQQDSSPEEETLLVPAGLQGNVPAAVSEDVAPRSAWRPRGTRWRSSLGIVTETAPPNLQGKLNTAAARTHKPPAAVPAIGR